MRSAAIGSSLVRTMTSTVSANDRRYSVIGSESAVEMTNRASSRLETATVSDSIVSPYT